MHISLSADNDEPFVINVYPYQKEHLNCLAKYTDTLWASTYDGRRVYVSLYLILSLAQLA